MSDEKAPAETAQASPPAKVRTSLRSDTLNKASFFNSFIMGQSIKKRRRKTRTKVALTPEQSDLQDIFSQATGYILRNAENTVATPFAITVIEMSNQDDDVLIFGSSNGNISRYDMKEGKIIDDIPLNIGMINSLVLDEENERAIIVGETSIVRVYKMPRFQLDYELTGHSLPINKCVLSFDNMNLFTVSDDSTVHMWDLQTQEDKGVIIKHNGMGKSLAITPSGSYVFSGGEDCLIRVYDLNLSQEVLNLKSHVACIFSLAVNYSSTLLASGGADNIVIVWNILDFTPSFVFNDHTGIINSLKFTEENGFLVSGSGDNSIKVWDLEKDRREITLNAHIAPVKDLLITSIQEYIVSCSDDKSLKIWSFPEFMEEKNFKILNNDFNSVIELNKCIISCGNDQKIRYWNRNTDEAGVIYTTRGKGLKCCHSFDKEFFVVGDDKGYLYIFSNDYTFIKEFQAHKGPVFDMCFVSYRELATGGGDSKVIIWNIETLKKNVLIGHQQSIFCLAYSNNISSFLVSGSKDKTIRLWNITDITEDSEIAIFQLQEVPTSLCVSNDGKYIISGGINGTLIVWSIVEKSEESIFYKHTDMITGLILSEDGDTITSVSKDRSIHFTSLLYRVPLSYITRKQPILCFTLSEDRDEIITGEHQIIYIQDNPIVCSRIRILGPEENIQKFLTYMRNLIKGSYVPHDLAMDNFIMIPFFFNTLHFYTAMGLREYLVASLVDTAVMIPSQHGYHPLFIALLKNFKGLRDDIIDALINLGSVNPFIYRILENIMVQMNEKAFPKLGNIYEAIFQPATRKNLPKFCSSNIDLPRTYISDQPRVVPEDFISSKDFVSLGTGIIFKESYVRLSYTMGSSSSIEFLTSLSNCSNLEVMRSPLVQSMIAYKWKTARYPMLIQGMCFYTYLIILSGYAAFFRSDDYFNGVLFFINTLLVLYELFQMFTSSSFYFSYIWNYIDWARSITLYIYLIINWVDKDNWLSSSVFSLSIFLSYVRGISYFRLFKLTRYLINLLFEVAKDTQGFLILLVYSILSFCFLFIVLNRSSENSQNESFSNYLMISYNLVLGTFSDKEGYDFIQYTCLTFALLINPIIMINLLISIIGDTYDRVQGDNLSADMKELMDMIQEAENMMIFSRNNNSIKFFQVCAEFEKENQDDGWEGKLRELQAVIDSIEVNNQNNQKALIKKLNTQDKFLEEQAKKIEMITTKILNKENIPENTKETSKKKKK